MKNRCKIICIIGIICFLQACASPNTANLKTNMDETKEIIDEGAGIETQSHEAHKEGDQATQKEVQEQKEIVDQRSADISSQNQEIITSTKELQEIIKQEMKKGQDDQKSNDIDYLSSASQSEDDNDDGFDDVKTDDEAMTESDSDETKTESTTSNTTTSMIQGSSTNQKGMSIEAHIIDLVSQWAISWSRMDYLSYTGFYKKNYSPKSWITHENWLSDRKKRLNKDYIKVEVLDIQVESIDDSKVNVYFNQTYESNTYSDKTRKQLVFHKIQNEWKIVKEETLLVIQ